MSTDELGDFTKIIIETMESVLNDSIDEMTMDIMSLKSVSMGEAYILATRFLLSGVTPKSDRFYENVGKIKTLWEK